MERPTCKTCQFWKKHDEVFHTCFEDELVGECRRFPPVIAPFMLRGRLMDSEAMFEGRHLDLPESHWCGEHPDFPAYIASLKAHAPPSNPAT